MKEIRELLEVIKLLGTAAICSPLFNDTLTFYICFEPSHRHEDGLTKLVDSEDEWFIIW